MRKVRDHADTQCARTVGPRTNESIVKANGAAARMQATRRKAVLASVPCIGSDQHAQLRRAFHMDTSIINQYAPASDLKK
jgi:hypothetical protein